VGCVSRGCGVSEQAWIGLGVFVGYFVFRVAKLFLR